MIRKWLEPLPVGWVVRLGQLYDWHPEGTTAVPQVRTRVRVTGFVLGEDGRDRVVVAYDVRSGRTHSNVEGEFLRAGRLVRR